MNCYNSNTRSLDLKTRWAANHASSVPAACGQRARPQFYDTLKIYNQGLSSDAKCDPTGAHPDEQGHKCARALRNRLVVATRAWVGRDF